MAFKRKKSRNREDKRPNIRNEFDEFRMTKPGGAALQRADAAMQDNYNIDDSLVNISQRMSNGAIEIDLPTGDYAYRGLLLMCNVDGATALAANGDLPAVAAADLSIAGNDGETYVRSKHFARLVKRVKLVADGEVLWDFESFERAAAYLHQAGWAFDEDEGAAYIGFGFPHVFRDPAMADLFAFGTANVDDLKMTIYTSDEFTDDMKLYIPAFYNPVRINAMNLVSRQVYRDTFSTVGKHVLKDIRIDRPIWRMVLTTPVGKQIRSYEVRIADVEWISARTQVNKLEAMLMQTVYGDQRQVGPYRGSSGALKGVGACIDLRADTNREGRSIAPLISEEHRRRDARIEIEIDCLHENTEVTLEVFYSDRV